MYLRTPFILTLLVATAASAVEVPDDLRLSIESESRVCAAYDTEAGRQECIDDVVARHLKIWEQRETARVQSERQHEARNAARLEYEKHRRSGHTWRRVESTDLVSGGKSVTLVAKSKNTHRFKFPYSGEQFAELALRNHPRFGHSIILQLSKGQFVCDNFDGCNVTIRIGDAQPRQIRARPPSDYSSDTLFLGGRFTNQLWNEILRADRVVISAVVYREGAPAFEFFTMQNPNR